MDNIDEKFNQLVAQLGDMPDPAAAISLWDLNNTVMKISETSMYLTEFISISLAANHMLELPHELVVQIPRLNKICTDISEMLHDITCTSCAMEEEDEEDEDQD